MKASTTFQPEIQGLRAVAVLAVLGFHLWPTRVTGGYVGVDIFFVISGYLITRLLLREYETTGRISISDFYARRVRRLLPAATAVLIAVAATTPLLPDVRWENAATDIAASALYFENWWLAHQSVDYLASDNAPSSLQHFWSLSVEEQYYIVWPLLLLLAAHFTRWTIRNPKKAFGALVVGIGGASLLFSIYLTPRNPGVAYFATTTRAWELALGGALAVFTRWQEWPKYLRLFLSCLGVVFIGYSIAGFTTATPFPGYAALLPTIGAALVIMAGRLPDIVSPSAVLASRPAQAVGDLSYSLYLWHWPLIIFYKARFGEALSAAEALSILACSLGLAWLSKAWIEDRFRFSRAVVPAGHRRVWIMAGICLSLSVLCSMLVYELAKSSSAPAGMPTALNEADYPGARVLTDHVKPADPQLPYLPRPVDAFKDASEAYTDHCIAPDQSDDLRECHYGADAPGAFQIVVVGDSHAVQWLPSLRSIAVERGWSMRVLFKSACAFVDIDPRDFKDEQSRLCASWNRKAIATIASYKPDMIVISQSVSSLSHLSSKSTTKPRKSLVPEMLLAWKRAAGVASVIAAIKDTPRPGQNIPDCLSAGGATLDDCAVPRRKAVLRRDPLVIAAARVKQAHVIDMDDAICGKSLCEPVVGNVLVWRDSHHLTAAFARTLAPALARQLVPMAERARKDMSRGVEVELDFGKHAKRTYDRITESRSGLHYRRQAYTINSHSLADATRLVSRGLQRSGYKIGRFNETPHGAIARTVGRIPSISVSIAKAPPRLKEVAAGTTFLVSLSWRVGD